MNILDYRRADIRAPAREVGVAGIVSLMLSVVLLLVSIRGLLLFHNHVMQRSFVEDTAPLWLVGATCCGALIARALGRPLTRTTGRRWPACVAMFVLMLSLLILVLGYLLGSI